MDYEKIGFSKIEMSQTVPTSNTFYIQSSLLDPYEAYADSFDLSLLPSTNDGEVPLSPQSELQSSQSQLMSIDYIPTTIYHDQLSIKTEKSFSSPSSPSSSSWNQEAKDNITTVNSNDNNNNTSSNNSDSASSADLLSQQQQQQQQPIQTDTSILLQHLQKQYQFYPSPLPSPPQDTLSSTTTIITQGIVYPPSPCPSIEQNFHNFKAIKQEFHILPPSPPESNGAPSPCSEIKSEPDSDTETLIDINSLLEKSIQTFEQEQFGTQSSASATDTASVSAGSAVGVVSSTTSTKKPQDHQLLREYLQDTSFQRKHNLKPLALESLFGGLGVRGDIEPVISLALEHAKRDAQATCAVLKISPDPQQWTTSQVHAWIRFTIEQFKLPTIDDIELKFPENGTSLICLSEEEFLRRLPESGVTIHAQLEIWKLACSDSFSSDFMSSTTTFPFQPITNNWDSNGQQPMDTSDDEDEKLIPTTTTTTLNTSQLGPISPSTNGINNSPPAIDITAKSTNVTTITTLISGTTTATPPPPAATPSVTSPPTKTAGVNRPGGSHIHLWQFLKELLSNPQVHGTAIRWLDRNKGVFKIEDSVRVAKLWGRRKNRPAMNYDKLSRSIRQYYKKGIMKKTERSQRLVYQFCHPYYL